MNKSDIHLMSILVLLFVLLDLKNIKVKIAL